MGFVGGGTPTNFSNCIIPTFRHSMGSIYLIFYTCLRLRFVDLETNPVPRRPVLAVCRIICSNVQGCLRTLVT